MNFLLPQNVEWTEHIATRNGEPVARVLVSGTEIHFEALPGKSAMTRKNTLEFLRPILDKYGYVTTRVPISVTNHKLREILGFTKTWEDNEFTYWCLTALPFRKVTA